MGKKQHQKDRLFLTRTEWNQEWGGHKTKEAFAALKFRSLPFYCCGLSLQPFQDPCCTKTNGTIYDITSLVPYVQKHKCHPGTGERCDLKTLGLVKLNFHKNDSTGEYCCPVLGKVFTNSTHIVAIASTGNVYSFEAVNELCLKPKSYVDLLDETKTFKGKQEVIDVQNPNDVRARAVENLHSVRKGHENPGGRAGGEGGSVRVTSEDARGILDKIAGGAGDRKPTPKPSAPAGRAAPKSGALASERTNEIAVRRKAGTATWDSSSGGAQAETRAPDKGPGAKLGRLEAKGLCSTGTVSRSFTSTSMSVSTRTELETVRRDLKPKKGAKGYVRLVTTFGDLNLELHCDICPRTCENFIGLCKRGYYDGVSFHRVIPGFMAQGGDPSGTGRGGESIYGGPFRCEIDSRLCHKGRGVLAMANRGRDTNTSQFYLTFRSAPHLDRKHTVFGKVVGGMSTLDAIEGVPTCDKTDRPLREVKVTSTRVFSDPFEEMLMEEERLEMEKKRKSVEEEANKAEDDDRAGSWYSNPGGSSSGGRGGVGKYLEAAKTAEQQRQRQHPPPPAKKKAKTSSYGNFDGW